MMTDALAEAVGRENGYKHWKALSWWRKKVQIQRGSIMYVDYMLFTVIALATGVIILLRILSSNMKTALVQTAMS